MKKTEMLIQFFELTIQLLHLLLEAIPYLLG